MNSPPADVKSIFGKALELPGAAERAAYLDEACAAHPELRAEVEALLAALQVAGGFMARPAAGPATADMSGVEGAGSSIGPYRLLQQIGAGGMGIVYMAEQQEPLRRLVALKIIKPGMDSAQVIARFESERQALALMDHPNIARVFDADTTPTGRPFFVMELVKGVPITQFCDDHQLNPRERLELFIPVCQAVQHAHQKGIIHRDLKPSNVLVARYDDMAVPKVIDFGVAKATSQRLTERTMFTAFGTVVGTPEYMSPEQAQLNALDVDTRSDIYSLGVLLYELLTGSTPLGHEELRQAALDELLRRIREEEPPKPSTRLSQSGAALATISARRRTEPAQLGRVLRGELDWIVMKSLEKERARRYEAAGALARDLQRYLADEPVEASPPSTTYRLRKLARRHRAALLTLASFALLLVTGALVSSLLAVRAFRAEEQMTVARDVAEEARRTAVVARADAEDHARQAAAARETGRRQLYALAMSQAQAAWEHADTARMRKLLDDQRPQQGESDLRNFEWHFLSRLVHAARLTLHHDTANPVIEDVVYSGDGKTLLSLGRMGVIMSWDVASGRRIGRLDTHVDFVSGLSLHPGRGLVAFCAKGRDAEVWDLGLGQKVRTLPGKGAPRALAFSPDGRCLAVADDDQVRILDSASDRLVRRVTQAQPVARVAYSGDGRRLAIVYLVTLGITDATIAFLEVRDTATWEVLGQPVVKSYTIASMALNHDGSRLALAGGRGMNRAGVVEVYDAGTGQRLLEFNGHSETVRCVTFSGDGRRLASAAHDSTVRLLDATTGAELRSFRGQNDWYTTVAFSPDGQEIAAAGHNGAIEIWPIKQDPEVVVRAGALGLLDRSALAPATGRCADMKLFRGVAIRDAVTGATLTHLEGNAFGVTTPVFSADGTRVALGFPDGTLRVWHADHGRLCAEIAGGGAAFVALALSGDGTRLTAATTREHDKLPVLVRVWDVASGGLLCTASADQVDGLALSSDGRLLATGSLRRQVVLWDVDKGERRREFTLAHEVDYPPSTIAFSPDDTALAACTAGSWVQVFPVAGNSDPLVLRGHRRTVRHIGFSRDSKRLASVSDEEAVRVWDLSTGQEVLSRPLPLLPHAVGFTADNRRLLVLGKDGSIRCWDAGTK